MFNPKNLLRQCLLAVALLGSSLAAIAGPTYNVSINTSALSGTGKVDFYLGSSPAELPLTATLANFSSSFGAFDATTFGDVAFDANGNLVLSNQTGFAFAERAAALGGVLTFDLTFDGAFLDTAGAMDGLFSFGLYDAAGAVVDFATFNLSNTVAPIVIDVTGFAGATIALDAANAVPEPSSMLMMMTGLGLVGFTARRRKVRSTAATTA
jgi:hypothetical protein